MSYIKTNWQTGDIVTAEKLNKIENQLEKTGGVLVCRVNMETMVLDHTWAEINAADVVVLKALDDFRIYIACFVEPADPENEVYNYVVGFRSLAEDDSLIGFTCNAETDYPVFVQSPDSGGGVHQV